MKIKDIWNKFLELRKSHVCVLFAIIGLLDIVFWLFDLMFIADSILLQYDKTLETKYLDTVLLYFLFRGYMCFRFAGFWYYLAALLTLFFVEITLKLKIQKDYAENSRVYKYVWTIGFIAFIFFSILIPFLTGPLQFLWTFF